MTNVRGERKIKVLAISFAIFSLALSLAIVKTRASADSKPMSVDERQSILLINNTRKERNLNPLSWNEQLASAAQEKANDMLERGYFDHASPSGEMVWKTIEKDGYKYSTAGENLAIDYENVNKAYDAWIKSPSHLDNIISSKYTDFGFAVVEGLYEGKDTKFFVQIFASPEPIYERVLTNIGGSNV